MNWNAVTIAGNLTKEPESRFTPKGTCICTITVAVNKKWTDDSGQKREKVAFIDVKFWGKRGEAVAQWFKKGDPILIGGELEQETWDDKTTGKKRSKLVVLGSEFTFVKSGGQAQKPNEDAAPRPARPTAPATDPADEPPHEGDDVPF